MTFDQADYILAEDRFLLTVTGRLTGLTGELQTDFSLTLGVDFSVDTFTGKPYKIAYNENDAFSIYRY